MDVVFD